MAVLTISAVNGAPATRRELPAAGELTIGRGDGNMLVLPGSDVSRQHAAVVREGAGYALVDRHSRTGTLLNGRPLAGPAPLKNGDRIGIGACVLVFEADGLPAADDEDEVIERDPASLQLSVLYTPAMMAMKRRIHEQVLQKLNLPEVAAKQIQNEELRTRLEAALDQVLREVQHELARDLPMQAFRAALLDELVGYGPISPMLRDAGVDEVMVNGALKVFVERAGKLYETDARFFNDRHLLTIIQRIVEPLGRHVDEASPMVDARLPDGSRVNAIIGPLALDGPALTIRKFATKKLGAEDLVNFGSLTADMAAFLREAVRARQNVLISGGTGSGKTTLLNVLSQFIGRGERVVTIEDSAELKLSHSNLVRLEGRPANIEGRGLVTIRSLVVNALRMRPDRIIVGECRGAEALDMLQAMNTGHDGSLTTVHANTPRDSLSRLETMVLMAGYDLPSAAIRDQIASAVDLVVQQNRMPDGSRKIVQISEVTGREGPMILMQDIFLFKQEGFSDKGKVLGRYMPTGNIPRFVEELKLKGNLRLNMSVFVPRE